MLRPILFKIISTTQLKIGFNQTLSEDISIDNFKIEAISGSDLDLEVLSVQIDSKSLTLNTRPHKSKAYYVLKLLDSDLVEFADDKGNRLIDDDSSRDIYFIGIEKANQIRDDIFFKTPGLYNLEETLVNSILNVQADQLLDVQHAIGSVLNDNYISQIVENEYRVRSSGATDRLSNENAYKIDRVSLFPSGTSILTRTIEIDNTNIYPINLRQELVESYEIDASNSSAAFVGFLISLPNKNIIKVVSAKLIKETDTADCDGNIGTEYDLSKFKYSISSNRYDQKNAFSNSELSSNQVVFSDFGNWDRPERADTIIISYYYDNKAILVSTGTVDVFETVAVLNESVPSNSKAFSLQHGLIIDTLDEQPDLDGVTFKVSENSTDVPSQFSKELIYNFSSLPKTTGEFSINYKTGDIFVVGDKIGEGTGYNYLFADYRYKKVYKRDLDYSVSESELNLNYLRPLFSKTIKITFDYENVFAEGTDYTAMVHNEVLGESVENRVSSSFSLKTKNSPITDVFRIYNQTSGEVYSLNYFSDNEVFFTGNKLPSAKEVVGESARFVRKDVEELYASGTFISPIHSATISSNATTSTIEFIPGIPAEFINLSTDYFIRFTENEFDDYNVVNFYSEDSNALIKGFSVNSALAIPELGAKIQIGARSLIFNLPDNKILNASNDGLGCSLNTSILLDSTLFVSEKFFEPLSNNIGLSIASSGSQTFTTSSDETDTLNKNLARLRLYGDYTIDYKNGVLYLAVNESSQFEGGTASYVIAKDSTSDKNIISVNSIYKKLQNNDQITLKYDRYLFTDKEIEILDIDNTMSIYDGTTIISSSGEIKDKLIVDEFYTAIVDNNISTIRFVGELKDIFGENLDSSLESERYLESNRSDLILDRTLGGKNFYIQKYVSFSENIVDFKASSFSKFSISGVGIEIKFKTPDIDSIYAVYDRGDNVILNADHNLEIQKDMVVSSIENYSSTEYKVSFESISTEYTFNSGYDYITDGTNRWLITGVSLLEYFIINKLSEVGSVDFSLEQFDIILRPTITQSTQTTIFYPLNNFVASGSTATLKYITVYSPTPSTALAIEYSCGNIYFDYVSLIDNLVVYYEYGDNEIDWGINNSITEGQQYFVSYKYGALRKALKKNFGRLTSIPFFDNQSLSIDRELYRDAVAGVLSAFPKGPTIPAISGLVQSVAKTVPKINELSFGSWILGRDYLSPQTVSYTGNLEFLDGKFGTGLKINDDNVISIPSVSNLQLSEGTVEMWVTPDWYGVNNDADLTFDFQNVGTKKYYYIGGDPFSFKNGYDVIGSDDVNDQYHGFDSSGGKLTIFKASSELDGYTPDDYSILFGVFKKELALNREIRVHQTTEFSVNYSYLPRGESSFLRVIDSGAFGTADILIDNEHKMLSLRVSGTTVKEDGSSKIFTVGDLSSDVLSNFGPPYKTASCKCSFVNQLSVLENFADLEIKITFDTAILKTDIFENGLFGSITPNILMIVDNLGKFYKVIAVEDAFSGKKLLKNISPTISAIYVSRYPINYPELSGLEYSTINSVDFTTFVIVKKQISLRLLDNEKSSSYFSTQYIWDFDWSNKTKLIIDIDPISNRCFIKNESQKAGFFYTDLLDSDLISESGSDVSTGSSAIGVFGISSINLYKNLIELNYKFDISDIYLGSDGVNPYSNKFTVNRFSSDINMQGISDLSNSESGIYIGYDNDCLSPINENIGQWIFKTRFLKYSELPYDVEITGENATNLLEYVFIDDPIIGTIVTNGAFSSIAKGRRDVDNNCANTNTCSKHFRFIGNKLLDSDGWSLLQASESDVIDSVNSGREVESTSWRTVGSFSTATSGGIYRLSDMTSFGDPESYFDGSCGIVTTNSCIKGNIELTVAARITSFDSDVFSLSTDTVVLSSGMVIAEINSEDYDIGISLDSDSESNGLVSLVNLFTGEKLKTETFDWISQNFNKYTLLLDRDNSLVNIYVNENILIQYDLSAVTQVSEESDGCNININPGFSIMLIDQRLINSDNYLSTLSVPIIDINLVEGNSNYNAGTLKLEDSDIFITSDTTASFELHPNPSEADGVLVDGYISESDIDEILITSDLERYLLDSGASEDKSRISIFKDSKGFLNFRIIDDKKEQTIFNIASNIKHFVPGERHHIAASWKMNTSFEKDEMHLFIDGQEVPNLFRFGGSVPIRFNSKFSDVSKENLYNYIEKKIIFPDEITDGICATDSNVLSSASLVISNDLIGRSIIFGDNSSLDGKSKIILDVDSDSVALGDPITLEPYLFVASESAINFTVVPYADSVFTDLKNEKLSVFRKSCDGVEIELGGLGYTIVSGEIAISNYPDITSYRYNETTGVIEFIKKNDDCSYSSSVAKSDIDIHIKTFGLSGRRFKDIISISGTSLFKDEGFDPSAISSSRDNQSIVMTSGPVPKNLSDVVVRKYMLYNYPIPLDSLDVESSISAFELNIETMTSLETINISKNNDGRYFEIQIDSDNINFGVENTITVYGETDAGSSSEDITINKNGSFFTEERYLSLTSISGNLNIIDIDYDFLGTINIIEKNSIFIEDGDGDYAEIYRFSNGSFVLSIAGEDTYSPFELTPGYYILDYSAALKVSVNEVGDKLYIGNDLTETRPLVGSIDEFVVLNTMLKDLRVWEPSVSGTRTITEDFYRTNPQCITDSTLAIIDFESPIEKQSRRLRNKRFIDTVNNFKYGLSLKDREILLGNINNEDEFVNYMTFLGYSIDVSRELFFECSKAEGGPLYNLANYLPKIGSYNLSPNSVNSSFGQSGSFDKKSGLLISNNNNILRNDFGTIEFWYQPTLATTNDGTERTLFESSSVLAGRFTSTSSNLIKLTSPISKVISIKLLSSKRLSEESYYSKSEVPSILFNEITIDQIGRNTKGTGSDKDFSAGYTLSADGLEIALRDSLPGANIDIVVSYVPKQYSGEKVKIYKDAYSRIIARVESKDYAYLIPVEIAWVEETWHRISLSYNFKDNSKFIKFFVDGVLYDSIYLYDKDDSPIVFDSANIVNKINFTLSEQMSQIVIGNNFDLSSSATGLIDNIRISRTQRLYSKDSDGIEVDINYSANTAFVSPVKKDDLTTYIQDFDFESTDRNISLATVVDPKYGIFDFEVIVSDDFNKVVGIGNGEVEDMLVDLVERIKPAHSNSYVKFIEKKCKE